LLSIENIAACLAAITLLFVFMLWIDRWRRTYPQQITPLRAACLKESAGNLWIAGDFWVCASEANIKPYPLGRKDCAAAQTCRSGLRGELE
jgi:hypothetical protein